MMWLKGVMKMSQFDELINNLQTMEYAEKKQFLEYLVRIAERASHQLTQADKEALLSYAYEEVDRMLQAIPNAATYKEKDIIFECEDFLLGIVMHLSGSPTNLPQDRLLKIKALTELVDKERYIETTLDGIFKQPTIDEKDMNRLLFWVRSCTDEYQKSKLFLGLIHYQQDMAKLNDNAKNLLAEYIASEMHRLPTVESEDGWNTLELLADVSKYFAGDDVIPALRELMTLGRNHINYYAVDTLCTLGLNVPQSVINALARDLEYANLTYHALQRQGKTTLFPAECATEEYLAKSDLVHWLTYPTELGKAPDEIIYIGRVKKIFSKEVFHVFKYRSDSDTLDDDKKNKWLVGWSSDEGGTFSEFEELAQFEKGTPEKTLKCLKKRIVG
jgi:hypothetical protein